ncbi:MAG: Nif11 family protein [Negativicutes bacterium]|jgi:predicted ribosomally synthesized peptide with nif11-like leader
MSIVAAREFLARMNTDFAFRNNVENLELDEQTHYVAQAGYVFSVEELRAAVEPQDFLEQVIGGASEPQLMRFEDELIRSFQDVLRKD